MYVCVLYVYCVCNMRVCMHVCMHVCMQRGTERERGAQAKEYVNVSFDGAGTPDCLIWLRVGVMCAWAMHGAKGRARGI